MSALPIPNAIRMVRTVYVCAAAGPQTHETRAGLPGAGSASLVTSVSQADVYPIRSLPSRCRAHRRAQHGHCRTSPHAPARVRPRGRAGRRIAAHAATSAMLAALAPEPTADTWMSLGDMAHRVTGRLARRTGRDVP